MDNFLVSVHNILRWVILLMLIISIMKSLSGWMGRKSFTNGDRKTFLLTLIPTHLNLVIGLYQLLAGKYGIFNTKLPEGVSLMKDKFFRFYWVEHPTGMILAIILITLGYGVAKKPLADQTKFKRAFWFFFVALIIILATIPWPSREIVGRPIFPGV